MNEKENINEMLNIIMFDFKERLNKQNFCIMNQQIKIDIFELKLKEADQLLNLNKKNINNKYNPSIESRNNTSLINSNKFSKDITHLELNMQSKENYNDNKLNQTEMKILPFGVLQDKEQTIDLNEELTEYFWAPLAEFAKNKGTVKFGVDEYPAFLIPNHVVWGLTYRILDKLLTLLYL